MKLKLIKIGPFYEPFSGIKLAKIGPLVGGEMGSAHPLLSPGAKRATKSPLTPRYDHP